MIDNQRGVSIIAAIFLLVGLSLLGALMTVLVSSQSIGSVSDYQATQALYAAESAVQRAAFDINNNYSTPWAGTDCDAADQAAAVQLDPAIDAWFTIDASAAVIDSINVCQITATGMAGGSAAAPMTQREITATYTASFMNN